MTEKSHWINFIEDAFQRKKGNNSAYSYRAFSRDISVSQSVLSRVLAGKKKLTPEIALRIGLGLKLPNEQIVALLVSTLPEQTN